MCVLGSRTYTDESSVSPRHSPLKDIIFFQSRPTRKPTRKSRRDRSRRGTINKNKSLTKDITSYVRRRPRKKSSRVEILENEMMELREGNAKLQDLVTHLSRELRLVRKENRRILSKIVRK